MIGALKSVLKNVFVPVIDGSSSRSIEFYDGGEREGAIVFDESTDGFTFKVGGTGG